MLKTLLAGTALATLLAFAAQAQETPAAEAPDALPHSETTPPREVGNQQEPSTTVEEPIVPQTAEDNAAPPSAEEPTAPQITEDAGATSPDTMAPDTITGLPAGALPEGWAPVDLATVSPDLLIGADIRTPEGDTIAAVEDVLMSAEGKIDDVVARFGGFLGFGETQVLLAPEEISVATDPDGNVAVMTSLTPEELKARPEYVAPAGTDAAG